LVTGVQTCALPIFSYDVSELGFNYRIGELNAALGLVQLAQLGPRNKRRAELVELYRDRLARVPGMSVPFGTAAGTPSHHLMPSLLPVGTDRQKVMESLKAEGIQTSIHYRPVDTFTSYQQAGLGPRPHLTNTHAIGDRVLTLPLYPSMEPAQVEDVGRALERALAAAR